MNSDLIEMKCPKCNAPIAFHPDDAGARGKCPYCDEHFIIPSLGSNSVSASSSHFQHRSVCHPVDQRLSVPDPLDVFCPYCHKLLTFNSSDLGNDGECSDCGRNFVIPETDPIARYCAQVKFSRPNPSSDDCVPQMRRERKLESHSQYTSTIDDSNTRSYHWNASALLLIALVFICIVSYHLLKDSFTHLSWIDTDARIVSWTENDVLTQKRRTSYFRPQIYNARETNIHKHYIFEFHNKFYSGDFFDTIEDSKYWSKNSSRQLVDPGYYIPANVRFDPFNPSSNTLRSSFYEWKWAFISVVFLLCDLFLLIHHAWLAVFKREFFKSRFIRKLLEFLP